MEALERRERSAAELVHALRAPISLKRCSPRFRDGRLVSFHGHGLADIASGRPVTEDTVFRIASITKTFTAVAAMQLWERGLIDLDAPAQDYLRAYRLAPAKAGWRPATVRHLMTHTAGIPETMSLRDVLRPDWGETVPVDQPRPSLAEFYRGALRLEAEPGTRFVYGNHSPATLGQVVEDVSGQPLDRYFKEQIFEPLGMDRSDLVRSDRIRSRLATGYALAAGGATVVPPRSSSGGAASIYSTPQDWPLRLGTLGGGANGPRAGAPAGDGRHDVRATIGTDPRSLQGARFMRSISRGLAVEHRA